jgi:hypothetical protein
MKREEGDGMVKEKKRRRGGWSKGVVCVEWCGRGDEL